MEIGKYIEKEFEKTIRNNTEDIETLLGLPYPYTVPCPDDKFLEMYYWDTYFTNVGLIAKGNIELAKNNIDNMLFMVEKYGFMPNGNRVYYLNRSQPPFLWRGVKDIFEVTHDKEWLACAYKTLCKEYNFWLTKRLAPNGLNFYGNHEGLTEQIIQLLYKDFTKRSGGFTAEDYETQVKMAHSIRTFVESGWDCNSRFGLDGQFFNPVDLNSLLYGFEATMAEFSGVLDIEDSELWGNRAENRKIKMKEFMWSDEKNMYLDRNFITGEFSSVISAASLYPFFVKLSTDKENAKSIFERLILKYGISACADGESVNGFQWDYPNIWPPVQHIAYEAMNNCGLVNEAEEIKNIYIKLIETCFEKTGKLWEKYNGITGNVANEDYDAPSMMGWTSGVYWFFIYTN